MLRVNYRVTYGEVKVRNINETRILSVKIHPANALCAFIYHYKDDNGVKMAQLWNFLADKRHAERIIKHSSDHTLLGTSVVSVRLNIYYKESRTLIGPLCKSGYRVSCYYKEPKEK